MQNKPKSLNRKEIFAGFTAVRLEGEVYKNWRIDKFKKNRLGTSEWKEIFFNINWCWVLKFEIIWGSLSTRDCVLIIKPCISFAKNIRYYVVYMMDFVSFNSSDFGFIMEAETCRSTAVACLHENGIYNWKTNTEPDCIAISVCFDRCAVMCLVW